MDDSLASIAGSTDAELRGAVHWWLRLNDCSTDSRTLKDFTNWLSERAAHRRAYARVEALWLTVQASQAAPATDNNEGP